MPALMNTSTQPALLSDPALDPRFKQMLAAIQQMNGPPLPPPPSMQPSAQDRQNALAQMFGQAAINSGNIGSGIAPGISPMDAYRASLEQKRTLAIEDWKNQLAVSQYNSTRSKPPTDDIANWMLHLADPSGGQKMDFPTFLATSKSGSSGGTALSQNLLLLQAVRDNKVPGVSEADLMTLLRAPTTINGMQPTIMVAPGGQPQVVVTPGQAAANAGTVAQATGYGTKTGGAEAERTQNSIDVALTAQNNWLNSQSMIDRSQELLTKLQSGQIDTGMIDGFLMNTFGVGSEELAKMDNAAVAQQLASLQGSGLTPVSNVDLAQVGKLWASISRGESANVGALEEAIARTRRAQAKIEREARSAIQRVNVYGNPQEVERLYQTSPWLRNLNASVSGTPAPGNQAPAGDPAPPAGFRKKGT